MRLLVLLCLLTAFIIAERFDNHSLIQVTFHEKKEFEVFQKIFKDVDIWTNEGVLVFDRPNDILFSPQQKAELIKHFASRNVSLNLLQYDIQKLIDIESKVNENEDDFFKSYHKYEEIVEFVKSFHAKYPDMTEIFYVAETHEKRQVIGLKVHSPGNYNSNKKHVWFSACQHAREWISPPVVLYAMQSFLEKYKSGDSRVVKILDALNFSFVPVINPDGYSYSHSTNRMWRKNRRNNGGGVYGVDLNRNWPYAWGGRGSSSIPSSDTYHGPSPASEPELQGIIKYFEQNPNIVLAIDFHSYSQLLLRPWQSSESACPDEPSLRAAGQKIVDAIKNTHGMTYQNIRGSQLYVHSGAMVDFFYASRGIKLAYTMELRDTGRYGFILPPAQIIPTCEENWNAILVICEHVLNQ